MYNSSLTRDILNVTRKREGICKDNVKHITSSILQFMPDCEITRIEKVTNNQYLFAAFEIKRAEILGKYEHCQTETLLHATSALKVRSILDENLNWRLVKRSKYGRGVSFTLDSKYANKYCNNRNGSERAFIICEVIIGIQRRVSDNYHHFPINGAHTYCSRNKKVYVKFDDFTFYPKFVFYYSHSVPNLSSENRFDNVCSKNELPAKSVKKKSQRYENGTGPEIRSATFYSANSNNQATLSQPHIQCKPTSISLNGESVAVPRNIPNYPHLSSYARIQQEQISRDSQRSTESSSTNGPTILSYYRVTRPTTALDHNVTAPSHRSILYDSVSTSTIHSSNSSRSSCNIL